MDVQGIGHTPASLSLAIYLSQETKMKQDIKQGRFFFENSGSQNKTFISGTSISVSPSQIKPYNYKSLPLIKIRQG